MVWLLFIISSAVVVIAALKLAQYGDVIAVRTKLSGMFIGPLLMAGATSLPELLAAVNALSIGAPNLAAGGLFGSSMFNMFMLGVLDLFNQKTRILRRVAMNHALTASLANMLMGLAVFFLLANVDLKLGWVGLDSLLIMIAYITARPYLFGNGLVSIPSNNRLRQLLLEINPGIPSCCA